MAPQRTPFGHVAAAAGAANANTARNVIRNRTAVGQGSARPPLAPLERDGLLQDRLGLAAVDRLGDGERRLELLGLLEQLAALGVELDRHLLGLAALERDAQLPDRQRLLGLCDAREAGHVLVRLDQVDEAAARLGRADADLVGA